MGDTALQSGAGLQTRTVYSQDALDNGKCLSGWRLECVQLSSGPFESKTRDGPLGIYGDDLALGDIQFMPIMLQWNAPPNWFVNASPQIEAIPYYFKMK